MQNTITVNDYNDIILKIRNSFILEGDFNAYFTVLGSSKNDSSEYDNWMHLIKRVSFFE